MFPIDPLVLAKFDRSVPRYTSYPTAPQFYSVSQDLLIQKIQLFDQTDKSLSIYIHIPFCKSMCLFCACGVILNRQPERQERYVVHLLQEIQQTARKFSKRRAIAQLHLGGGTPTSLTEGQFDRLFSCLREVFDFKMDAEISIEIDPRTVFEDKGLKLLHLHGLGFNRVSFGVQDLDPAVQKAVRRYQSQEMTVTTYQKAREIGFAGINMDLIYGLPLQTPSSFSKTIDTLLKLKPDRIAFYSYANVPWIKSHQKAISPSDLPSLQEKFQIYIETRQRLIQGGYVSLGMDHFSREEDPIVKAYREQKLTRNFQGYAVQLAEDMLGFGVTSIGFLENCFFQNVKGLEEYIDKLSKGDLPIFKGFSLSPEDLQRRFVIQTLMCSFELDKQEFTRLFNLDFDTHFALEKPKLAKLSQEGLIEETKDKISPTPLGRLFIRIIASTFDAYLDQGQFSSSI